MDGYGYIKNFVDSTKLNKEITEEYIDRNNLSKDSIINVLMLLRIYNVVFDTAIIVRRNEEIKLQSK